MKEELQKVKIQKLKDRLVEYEEELEKYSLHISTGMPQAVLNKTTILRAKISEIKWIITLLEGSQ